MKAKTLRKNTTDAEAIFWQKVRHRQIDGYKFKRQFPIGPYCVDFICVEEKLIVEIDGGQHNENVKDEIRTSFLNEEGYEVIRFWNNDVLGNLEAVLSSLSLTFSRKGGRGDCIALAELAP